MPIDGYCSVCAEPIVAVVRYPGGEIEHGICAVCIQDPRHKPLPECEVIPVTIGTIMEAT